MAVVELSDTAMFWGKIVVDAFLALLAYLGMRTINRIDDDVKSVKVDLTADRLNDKTELSNDIAAVKQDLATANNGLRMDLSILIKEHADHRVYSEKEFAKNETIQRTLERIHERIDGIPEQVINLIRKE